MLWLIGRQYSAWEMFISILEKVLIMEIVLIFLKAFYNLLRSLHGTSLCVYVVYYIILIRMHDWIDKLFQLSFK